MWVSERKNDWCGGEQEKQQLLKFTEHHVSSSVTYRPLLIFHCSNRHKSQTRCTRVWNQALCDFDSRSSSGRSSHLRFRRAAVVSTHSHPFTSNINAPGSSKGATLSLPLTGPLWRLCATQLAFKQLRFEPHCRNVRQTRVRTWVYNNSA